MSDPLVSGFTSELKKRLRTDMNNLADDLASNTCKTIEDYRLVCGKIEGLMQAEQHLLTLAKTIEESDE